MAYGKSDCGRGNGTLLLAPKVSKNSDESHNHRHDRRPDMPMVVSFFDAGFLLYVQVTYLPASEETVNRDFLLA